MNFLNLLSALFKPSLSTTDLHIDAATEKQRWEAKYNDTGIFSYNDSGFDIELHNKLYSVKWADVERLQAYKVDLMTTDEICMNITFNGQLIMITEETAGWYQFIERLKTALPNINSNWEASVLKTPFEYDLTIIYERADKKMPEK